MENSKKNVILGLLRSLDTWESNLSRSNDDSAKENIQDLINWNGALIVKKYSKELFEIIRKGKVMELMKRFRRI